MMVPDYVRAYEAAEAWEFLHYGVPAILALILIVVIKAYLEYREDCSVNDESEFGNDLSILPGDDNDDLE